MLLRQNTLRVFRVRVGVCMYVCYWQNSPFVLLGLLHLQLQSMEKRYLLTFFCLHNLTSATIPGSDLSLLVGLLTGMQK